MDSYPHSRADAKPMGRKPFPDSGMAMSFTYDEGRTLRRTLVVLYNFIINDIAWDGPCRAPSG
jgi:hypothetical protein